MKCESESESGGVCMCLLHKLLPNSLTSGETRLEQFERVGFWLLFGWMDGCVIVCSCGWVGVTCELT